MSRKARRKYNAKRRAAGLPVHCEQAVEPFLEANIPTRNNFGMLKWVKRNDAVGKVKKSFWDVRPAPQQKEETISSKIYKVLKAVKSKNLQKKYNKFVRRLANYNISYPNRGRGMHQYHARLNRSLNKMVMIFGHNRVERFLLAKKKESVQFLQTKRWRARASDTLFFFSEY